MYGVGKMGWGYVKGLLVALECWHAKRARLIFEGVVGGILIKFYVYFNKILYK